MSVTPYSPATAAATGAISTRHVRVRRQGRDDSPNELRAFGVAPAFFPLFRFHGADKLMSSSGRTASVAPSWNQLKNRPGGSPALDAGGLVTPPDIKVLGSGRRVVLGRPLVPDCAGAWT